MNQGNQGATVLNRINMVLPDHIMWIKSQFKKRKFMQTRGREVFVDVARTHLKRIVNIPSKDDPEYIEAWVKVYNYGLDYLEGSLNAACLENRFIRRVGNDWVLNGKPVIWPKFDSSSAKYAMELESILDEYSLIKEEYIRSRNKPNDAISFKKSSVMLDPVNKVQVPKKTSSVEVPEKTMPVVKNISIRNSEITTEEPFIIQKVSDGDILNKRDMENLRSQRTDLVILTCQDINSAREEDIFINNAAKCQNEKFNVGAFIYGKATDEHMGAIELKRMIKVFNKFDDNFSGFVIYSVDNNYIKKYKDSDIKLLDFINVYNAIANTLKKAGYTVMLSMDIDSAKIIGDINNRFHMQNEHDVIYMAVVRDVDEINSSASVIIVDPGNDYDTVNIKNKEIVNSLRTNMKSLAKVA